MHVRDVEKERVSTFLKILHPVGDPTPKELDDYIEHAVEVRRRIKEQLNTRKSDEEYASIRLSYIASDNAKVEVLCPESKNTEATQNPSRRQLERMMLPVDMMRFRRAMKTDFTFVPSRVMVSVVPTDDGSFTVTPELQNGAQGVAVGAELRAVPPDFVLAAERLDPWIDIFEGAATVEIDETVEGIRMQALQFSFLRDGCGGVGPKKLLLPDGIFRAVGNPGIRTRKPLDREGHTYSDSAHGLSCRGTHHPLRCVVSGYFAGKV